MTKTSAAVALVFASAAHTYSHMFVLFFATVVLVFPPGADGLVRLLSEHVPQVSGSFLSLMAGEEKLRGDPRPQLP